MPTSEVNTAAPAAGEQDLSRTYVLVILVEVVVISALYWLGAHFA